MVVLDFMMNEPALAAGFAAVLAAFGYALLEAWRDKRRSKAGEIVRSTTVSMTQTICLLWLLCAACLIAWIASDRTFTELGLHAGEGWRALCAWTFAVAAAGWLVFDSLRSISTAQRREALADQMAAVGGLGHFELRTAREVSVFQTMAVTAGLTEEIIFRGFVLLSLTLILPFWAAAVLSALIFILFHAYQGLSGMIRIVPITLVLTGLVIMGGTLWPAILLHIVVDMVGGIVLWGARSEIAAQRAAVR